MAMSVVPMDYGVYGLLLIFIYRFFAVDWKMIALHVWLNIIFLFLYGTGYAIQLFSIAGSLLILYCNKRNAQSRTNHWMYRYFYPVHLAVISIFRL